MRRPSSRQALIYSFVLQPEGFKELDLKPGSTYAENNSLFKIYGDGQIGACEHAYLNKPPAENTIFKVRGYLPRVFINETTKNHIESSGLTGTLIREYKNP